MENNLNPVDYCTFYLPFASIFDGMRDAHLITDNECAIIGPENPTSKATFIYSNNIVEVVGPNKYFKEKFISKFTLLSGIKFKHNYHQTCSYVLHELMGNPIPYVRVGTDYFKVIQKDDRYGGTQTHLKNWKIEIIKRDHSNYLISQIPAFDDFIITPDNKNYQPIIKNCYNLYSKFSHEPRAGEIPTSLHFMKHIFGDQLELGLRYLKILYEKPTQILPILTLASKERDTGKTTFINWMEMIFGANSVLISPEDLIHPFNSNYASKNIILVDETFIEKQSGVEKLKSLSTAKSLKVSQKNVSEYNIPFYGKFILCTNKIRDFMRIDEDEVRFWIREIPKIEGKKNTKIEDQLMSEVPAFIQYLIDLPAINYDTGSRMVFTKDEIKTDALIVVKSESKNSLQKAIEIHCEEFFDGNNMKEFYATVTDIKNRWFSHNSRVDVEYLSKVLRIEMKMKSEKLMKYNRFDEQGPGVNGRPYKFVRIGDVLEIDQDSLFNQEEPPF